MANVSTPLQPEGKGSASSKSSARHSSKPRKQSDQRIHLLHADELYYNQRIHREAQILVGNVRFRHEGVILTCDSALYFQADNSFDAFGNVHMNQADTLTLVSDVLFYDGADQLARARHHVVLTHRESRLYCDSLDYDRLYDLGYFFNGGRLVDKENILTSEWGQYSPSTREAVFNYNVDLKNPNFTLISDTLHYNTGTGFARIVGPSNIDSEDNHIYSERGTYDTHADRAYLLDRSIVSNLGTSIEGDSLYYQGDSALSKAFGNVIYIDKDNRNEFRGHYALYCDSTGYAEAADSAVCIDYSQRDTFYIHADTFKLFTYPVIPDSLAGDSAALAASDSVWRELRAYNHVRAYRVDLQGVCDSLVFISRDSCMTMYHDPILWQNGQQLLGEEIKAWMNDSTIDSTHVIRQALSVERIDSMSYNQATGNIMRSYFSNGQMHTSVVEGNVIVNYFPFDSDSLMIGMLHAEGSLLNLYMGEHQLEKIMFIGETDGRLHPLALTPFKERCLENFVWFDYVRPLNKDDIFHWRPKKQGTELKPSVHHTPPRSKGGPKADKAVEKQAKVKALR
ncbi:MAG: hypothetical protein J6W75_08850 [Bacteroidaceae bacterium]|nr:hypothetical protein [Bacteroidaceae bacterium]